MLFHFTHVSEFYSLPIFRLSFQMVSSLHRNRELLDSSCAGHLFIDMSYLCLGACASPRPSYCHLFFELGIVILELSYQQSRFDGEMIKLRLYITSQDTTHCVGT